jgi:hypothetical protein
MCLWLGLARRYTNIQGNLFSRALVAQRIEQKTFRLPTPPPHRTTYEGSRAEVAGRAICVR